MLTAESTQTNQAAQERIAEAIQAGDVVLFMKGTPEAPQCGFSHQVSQLLAYMGVPFHSVNVLADEGIRQGIKQYSDWPTIPQLYVKGEFLGGCDIVREMFQSGELQRLMTEKGIPAQAQ